MQEPLHNRMRNWETDPPREAWQHIAAALEEVNAENRLSKRMHALELIPPAGTWNIIREGIQREEQKTLPKIQAPVKKLYPYVFRYGAVALVAGLLTWIFIGQPFEAPNKAVTSVIPSTPTNPKTPETARVASPANLTVINKRTIGPSSQKSRLAQASVVPDSYHRIPQYAVQHFQIEEDSHLLAVVRPIGINRAPSLAQQELTVQQRDPRYILVSSENGQPVRLSAKFAPLFYAMSQQNAVGSAGQVEKLLKKLKKQISKKPFIPDPNNHLDMMQLTDLLRK